MVPGEIYKIQSKSKKFKNLKYLKFSNVKKSDDAFIFSFKGITIDSEKIDGEMLGNEIFDFIKESSLSIADDSDKAKILLSNKGF